jgi:hypothetical protein
MARPVKCLAAVHASAMGRPRARPAQIAAESTHPPPWSQPGIHEGVGIVTAAAVQVPSRTLRDTLGAEYAMVVQRTSFVVFPGCLMTLRWPLEAVTAHTATGASARMAAQEAVFVDPRTLRDWVARDWQAAPATRSPGQTLLVRLFDADVRRDSGDLGVLGVLQLTKSFPAVLGQLEVDVDELEGRHLSGFDDPTQRRPPGAAPESQWIELTHVLRTFDRHAASMLRYGGRFDLTHDEETRKGVTRQYREAHERLRGLRQDARDTMDSIAGLYAARDQRRADYTRKTLERLTAAVLVPSLVAAFFGANSIELPREGVEETALLLAIMALAGIASFLLLESVRRRASARRADSGDLARS